MDWTQQDSAYQYNQERVLKTLQAYCPKQNFFNTFKFVFEVE
jgi:hypothetical protein